MPAGDRSASANDSAGIRRRSFSHGGGDPAAYGDEDVPGSRQPRRREVGEAVVTTPCPSNTPRLTTSCDVVVTACRSHQEFVDAHDGASGSRPPPPRRRSVDAGKAAAAVSVPRNQQPDAQQNEPVVWQSSPMLEQRRRSAGRVAPQPPPSSAPPPSQQPPEQLLDLAGRAGLDRLCEQLLVFQWVT